jgi:transposase
VISPSSIAWLAGFLEAEGSFLMSGRSIAVIVSSADRDIVDRAADLLRGTVYALPIPKIDRPRVQMWRAQVKGPWAAAWMMTIYPLLGIRRRGQVVAALSAWRAMRYVRISPLIERSIIEEWKAGNTNKCALARRFGISRATVYSVIVDRDDRGFRLREADRHRITDMEIAWLAGLVEGDGNIAFNGRSITIRIKMTDHDVVFRAANLLCGKVRPAKAHLGHRPQWLTQVKGETAAAWAMTLYTWLGIRRRKQVRDALVQWKRQLNGVIGRSVIDAIVAHRAAGLCQTDIMALMNVSKSTVYRHTRHRVRRMRVTRRDPDIRPRPAALGSAVPSVAACP